MYAARAIEQGSPSLKNSLINLLFFRERRAGISDAVYRTLEEQAAQRLTRVPVETSVDRSLLIRLGYVLVGVVAIAGLYKVFSPKDPLVSAERILLPWADIVPASRVTIAAVTPGSVTVSRGEFVDVSAEVHGLGDDDAMVLRYTTDDGQVVGKPIPMKPAGDGLRYACRVADEADGSEPVGLTRSLKYRLEAGDARSLDYSIKVVSAPSILVERVDYHYPPYTGYVDRTVDGLGDIRAIEGTRMTIHARANGAIRVADVDFDADGRPDLRMTTKETGADASFELSLREDRQTPRHASYVLRFTNDEGRANRDPVKHSIAVDRDHDPEAAVLLPKEKSIDARLDETVAIEVEASDPDFKLSAVRLHGEAAGQSVLDESLLKAEHRGRFTTRYSFVPNAHGLKAGDVVQLLGRGGRQPYAEAKHGGYEEGEADDSDCFAESQLNNRRRTAWRGTIGSNRNRAPISRAVSKNKAVSREERTRAKRTKAEPPVRRITPISSKAARLAGNNSLARNRVSRTARSNKAAVKVIRAASRKPTISSSRKAIRNRAARARPRTRKAAIKKATSRSPAKTDKADRNRNRAMDQPISSNPKVNKPAREPRAASRRKTLRSPMAPDPIKGRSKRARKGSRETGRRGQQQGEKQSKPGDQQPAVSSEGDNDGEAFERIQKHMEQSGDLKKDEKAGGEAGQSAEQKQEGAKQEGEKSQARETGKISHKARARQARASRRMASPLQRTGSLARSRATQIKSNSRTGREKNRIKALARSLMAMMLSKRKSRSPAMAMNKRSRRKARRRAAQDRPALVMKNSLRVRRTRSQTRSR